MSQKQIHQLNCDHQQCIVQIYGKTENMISDYCPISQYYFGYQKKNCQLCKSSQYALIDRKNETFDLMMDNQDVYKRQVIHQEQFFCYHAYA